MTFLCVGTTKIIILLLVIFNDLKEDHASNVHRITKHMGVDCTKDEIALFGIVHTTSHAEMSRHATTFTLHKIITKFAERIGEEYSMSAENEMISQVHSKMAVYKSGEGKQQLPVEIQQKIEQLWQKISTSKLGPQNLEEMRAAWKMEQLK